MGHGLGAFNILLVTLLFLLGCYAVIQSISICQYEIRFKREIKSFGCLHEITHIFRRYRAFKVRQENRGVPVLNRREIIETLNKLCEKLISEYLKPRHGPDVTLCIKYLKQKKMHNIRVGPRSDRNNSEAEHVDNCHVFQRIVNDKKIKILHVEDTQNDQLLRKKIGRPDDAEKIRHRAAIQGYRTFWAMPIRTGKTQLEDATCVKKIPLGFLGCDLPYPYGFGNISDQEVDFLACVVDAISELLYDLNFAYENEVGKSNGDELL
jgi:hypothetical protein